MKLKNPIEVNEKTFNQLQALDMKFLLFKEALMVISDFKGERILMPKKSLGNKLWPFTRKKKEPMYLITHINLWCWNHDKSFWGTFDEDRVRYFIHFWNFQYFRERFESFKHAFYKVNYEFALRRKSPLEDDQTHNYD